MLIGEDHEVRRLPLQDPSLLSNSELKELISSYLEISFSSPSEVAALPWQTADGLEVYILRLHGEVPKGESLVLTPYSLTRPLVSKENEELLVAQLRLDGFEKPWTIVHGVTRGGATFFFDVIPPEDEHRVQQVVDEITSERSHIPISELDLNQAWSSLEGIPSQLLLSTPRLPVYIKRVVAAALCIFLLVGAWWARSKYRAFALAKASLVELRKQDAQLSQRIADLRRTLTRFEEIPSELTKQWVPYNELKRLSQLYDPNSFWVKSLVMSRANGIERITFVLHGKTAEAIREAAKRLIRAFPDHQYTYRRPIIQHGFILMEITFFREGEGNDVPSRSISMAETETLGNGVLVPSALSSSCGGDGLAVQPTVTSVPRADGSDSAAHKEERSRGQVAGATRQRALHPITALLSWFPPAPAHAAEQAHLRVTRREVAQNRAAETPGMPGHPSGLGEPTAAGRGAQAAAQLPDGHRDQRGARRGVRAHLPGPDPKKLRLLLDHGIRDFMALPPALLKPQPARAKHKKVPQFLELDAVAARLSEEPHGGDMPKMSLVAVFDSGCLLRVNGRLQFLRTGQSTGEGVTLVRADPPRGAVVVEHAGENLELRVFEWQTRWEVQQLGQRW